jgi:hypothetical protein
MSVRLIAATDSEIDRLVYDLYGLTASEIAIVEGKNDGTNGTDRTNGTDGTDGVRR